MEIEGERPLVFNHEAGFAPGILRGDARGAMIVVALLGLHAADGEHEGACRLAPVGAEREVRRAVVPVYDLAGDAKPDSIAKAGSRQRVDDEDQTLPQGLADTVGQFRRSGPRASLGPVDHDEIGRDPRLQHRLHEREELPAVTDAELEADGLAARQFTQLGNPIHHSDGGRKGGMARRGMHVLAQRHAPRLCDRRRHLGTRQEPALTGLCTLTELDLDHLHLIERGPLREHLLIEAPIRRAAAEISGADLPDEIAAMAQMVWGDPALSGIVIKAAQLRAHVQRLDRATAQRTEAHRQDVEDRDAVGLPAFRPTDHDSITGHILFMPNE